MAKAKTGGLGRGLDYLFGDSRFEPDPASVIDPKKSGAPDGQEGAQSPSQAAEQQDQNGERVVYIKLNDIKPNSRQPRKVFNEEALEELASSISEHGVIQPVLLRPAAAGYELVAGERRWRAARKAGLKEIPAIIRDLDDRQNAFYALIENMQREDLNAIEEAEGLQLMMDEFGLSQQDAAKAVGKSRPYVSNSLRLLGLPEAVRERVSAGELSAGHARAIAGLQTEALQLEAAEKAVSEGWSVRKIESYTGAKGPTSRKQSRRKRKKAKSAEITGIEQQLTEKLGTRVRLDGSEKKGSLILEYYSRDELEQLIETLLK